MFFFSDDDPHAEMYRDLLLAGIIIIVVVPLCFLPTLDSLKFNSWMDVIVMAYLCIVLIIVFGGG